MVKLKDSNSETVQRHLEAAAKRNAESIEKLASGQVFTSGDPRPSERAVAARLEQRIRSLSAAKQSISDAMSLVQTADSGLSQITDIVIRMKEINLAATNQSISDQDRKYLFVEYEALRNEVARVTQSTTFNDVPLLDGKSDAAPEFFSFRLDDPSNLDDRRSKPEDDLSQIFIDRVKDIALMPDDLGLLSAGKLVSKLSASEGISIDDAMEFLEPLNKDFANVYDEALTTIANIRSTFGAAQVRLDHAHNFNEVFSENIAAAKSHISDTDYASEVSKMAASRILMQAGTSMLAQANISGNLVATLLQF